MLTLLAGAAGAHELQPGFLELREGEAGRYEVLWKVPAAVQVAPVFPEGCRQLGDARTERSGTAWVSTARIACEQGLAGQKIAVEGLEAYSTDVLLRVQHRDGSVETRIVKPDEPSITLRSAGETSRGAAAYVWLGIAHIALGIDHLLFVLGLLLIVREPWTLVKTITAFTVAHSITLAAATFQVIAVPPAPLNAAIALSILFLGPEIVRVWRGETSFTIRRPWVVAFVFGLLHGVGFASGLTSLGLPRAEIPLALALFNVGVEAGQLAFVALVIALQRAWRVLEVRWPPFAARLPGYVVGTLGAFWTLFYSSAVFAHVEGGAAEGFVSGFGHPLSGWDHIVAMVAVGLWGAQLRAPAIWLLPVTFPLMMAFGGMLGLLAVPLPAVEVGIALSAIVLGALVAFEARLPLAAAMAIVAVFAVFHGYAHGAELAPGTSAVAYSLGFVIATGLLHGAGILVGTVHRWPAGRQALRGAGGLVAAAGVFFLARIVL
jgi:hydrogenase/urease accessory protein HupE